MFNSILTNSVSTLSLISVLVCIFTSVVLGLFIAFVHMKTSKYSKNFVITLALLPLLVQVVMMMVNGNLGTSVAILGAFSLVRFRSLPGTSREITSIFFAMTIGLSVGMGQIYFAILITVLVSVLLLIFYKSKFGEEKNVRILKIVVPEDLDFDNVFKNFFEKYSKNIILNEIKTINTESLFELKYKIILKDNINEKKFLDELKIKNGNLKIILTRELEKPSL